MPEVNDDVAQSGMPAYAVPVKHPFEKELEELINRHSMENDSNTPDFILAQYVLTCLSAYRNAVNKRDKWFGVRMPLSRENNKSI